MLKRLIYILTIGALAAGCSEVREDEEIKQILAAQPVPVSFGTYVTQNADTRATVVTPLPVQGATGSIDELSKLQEAGFGVFGYYTDGSQYSAADGTPNFMYNQAITHNGSAWTYAPTKYWPNETTKDQSGATSAHTDYLSFFAYAPYLRLVTDNDDPDKNNATVTTEGNLIDPTNYGQTDEQELRRWGIVNMSDNHGTGDPLLTYAPADISTESVDLLWGVAPKGGLKYTAVNGDAITVDEGKPLLNLVKPANNQKITFQFKHALARFGVQVNVGVDLWNDLTAADQTLTKQNTLITIDKLEITGNFPRQAQLNLNNTEAGSPRWANPIYDPQTTYDEETGTATKTPTTKHTYVIDDQSIAQSLRTPQYIWKDNDKSQGLDDDFSAQLNGSHRLIGGTDYVNLLTTTDGEALKTDGSNATYFNVIPDLTVGNTLLDVKITYSVTSVNPNLKLNDGYHRITQTVEAKNVSIDKMTAGNTYMLNLTLGLNAVRLKVNVYDWSEPIVFGVPTVKEWEDKSSDMEFDMKEYYYYLWTRSGSEFTGALPQEGATDQQKQELKEKLTRFKNELTATSALKFRVKTATPFNWYWGFSMSVSTNDTGGFAQLFDNTKWKYISGVPSTQDKNSPYTTYFPYESTDAGQIYYIYAPISRILMERYLNDKSAHLLFCTNDLHEIQVQFIEFVPDAGSKVSSDKYRVFKEDDTTELLPYDD